MIWRGTVYFPDACLRNESVQHKQPRKEMLVTVGGLHVVPVERGRSPKCHSVHERPNYSLPE